MSAALDDAIAAALDKVCDPCSLAANAPLSIVDLGLVRGWTIDGAGNVEVRMCVTSACCTMAPNIVRGAEQVLTAVPGVRSVRVEVDPSIGWTPDSMTERGRRLLAERREASVARHGIRPQQWRTKARAERPVA